MMEHTVMQRCPIEASESGKRALSILVVGDTAPVVLEFPRFGG